MARVFLNLLCALLLCGLPAAVLAQRIIRSSPDMPGIPGMPMPGGDSSSKSDSGKSSGGSPPIPTEPLSDPVSTNHQDDIQLSFQGANIDMVVQWLAQTTGKAVIKHPQVQCQLTITSSKKVSPREAINMVYRALAVEGYTAIESSKSILIVPEGKEPRMTPEVLSSTQKEIPEGRERLTKVFSLNHIQAATLKEKVQTALSDKATIEIDDHANQIIISDFNDNLRVASELIQALDTDRPQDVAVRVLPLKHMSAPDLAKELAPLYQKMSGKSSDSAIDVAADDRANSLMVLSGEADFTALRTLIDALDTEEAQEKIMRTFVLKNADAQDVAKQLQDLGQNQSNNRYPYWYYDFNSSDDSSAGKKMNVVADRRRNAVIIQAPPAAMDGIEKMIQELDQPVADDSLAPRIYRLKYVSAVDMEDVLNQLFLKKQQSTSYYDYIFGNGDNSQNSQDAGRLYGKVRITSEPYANAILVTSNSKEYLAVVEDVLRQLDAPSEGSESTLRVPLMFAKASTVAKGLNILFAKNGSPPLRPNTQQQQNNNNNNGNNGQQQQQQSDSSQASFALQQEIAEEGYYPWLGGTPDNAGGGRFGFGSSSSSRDNVRPVSDLVGRVRAIPDDRGNALVVSANVHYLPSVLKLINDLDAPSDQVVIDARIVEVSSDYLDKLGVRWSPNGAQEFTGNDLDNSVIATGTGTYSKGFGGTTTVNNTSAQNNFNPANLMQQIRSGVVSGTVNIDFLVQFLRETTDATLLSEPQLNISDNETGRLFVGQQVPVLTSVNNPALGGNTQTVAYKDVGVILEVTPHINSSGDVHLRIHAESSTIAPVPQVFGSDVFNTQNFQTDLTAKNGQTLVLGGIIQKQVTDTLRKTPILGSLPGLKWLVNKKDKDSQAVELMVFLRPRVIHDVSDEYKLLNDVNQSAPKMKRFEDDSMPKVTK